MTDRLTEDWTPEASPSPTPPESSEEVPAYGYTRSADHSPPQVRCARICQTLLAPKGISTLVEDVLCDIWEAHARDGGGDDQFESIDPACRKVLSAFLERFHGELAVVARGTRATQREILDAKDGMRKAEAAASALRTEVDDARRRETELSAAARALIWAVMLLPDTDTKARAVALMDEVPGWSLSSRLEAVTRIITAAARNLHSTISQSRTEADSARNANDELTAAARGAIEHAIARLPDEEAKTDARTLLQTRPLTDQLLLLDGFEKRVSEGVAVRQLRRSVQSLLVVPDFPAIGNLVIETLMRPGQEEEPDAESRALDSLLPAVICQAYGVPEGLSYYRPLFDEYLETVA